MAGALVLLHNVRPARRPKIDIPGAVTVSGGLFALVYGFNHAQTTSWGNPLTSACWPPASCCWPCSRSSSAAVAQPLLPPRVVTDRNRGGAFMSMLLASAAMFGVFLFLTYYLQQTRGYTPIQTGLAFLPMTVVVMVTAVTATTKLRDRVGPRVLVFSGMVMGAVGMLILTGLGVSLELRHGDPARRCC